MLRRSSNVELTVGTPRGLAQPKSDTSTVVMFSKTICRISLGDISDFIWLKSECIGGTGTSSPFGVPLSGPWIRSSGDANGEMVPCLDSAYWNGPISCETCKVCLNCTECDRGTLKTTSKMRFEFDSSLLRPIPVITSSSSPGFISHGDWRTWITDKTYSHTRSGDGKRVVDETASKRVDVKLVNEFQK